MGIFGILKDKFSWVIILLTVLVFSNSLNHSIVWDDHAFIQNQNHSQLPSLGSIIDGSYPVAGTGAYRPTRNAIYAITINTLKDNPSLHHLLVLSVHVICSLLVYELLKLLVGESTPTKLGSLLFSIHPLHTENINWITAGYDLFFVAFYLAAIISHIKSRRNNTNSNWPIVFTTLALFTNELALTIPLMIIAIDYYVFKLPILEKKYFETIIKYIIAALVYWMFRTNFITKNPFEVVVYDSVSGNLILGLILFGTYISQLFLPLSLNVDHYFQPGLTGLYSQNHNLTHPPPAIQFQSPNIYVPLAVAVIWIIITLISVYKKSKFSLPLIWVPISLIAVLRVVPLPAIYAERYAYLASVGFVLLLATALSRIKNAKFTKVVTVITIGVIAMYSLVSFDRNKDWANDFLLWSHALEGNLESASATSALGVQAYLMGDYKNSLILHRKSAQMSPYVSSFQQNYVSSLSLAKKYDEIIEFVNLIAKTDSDNLNLYTILASTYDAKGDYKNAMENYQKAYDLSIAGSPAQEEIEDLVEKLDEKYQLVDLK